MSAKDVSGNTRRRITKLLWAFLAAACCDGAEIAAAGEQTTLLTPERQASSASGPAGLTLRSDRTGHFRGTAMINNVPMPYMIDTGATVTVIPKELADAAKPPIGRDTDTATAGGTVKVSQTKISKLKIGNLEIDNLDGLISYDFNYVLIGMNALKHFRRRKTRSTRLIWR